MEVISPNKRVTLVQKSQERNIQLCIICQKFKDNKQSKKLTITSGEHPVIIQRSGIWHDYLLIKSTDKDLQSTLYHVWTCYSRYKLSGERQKTSEVPEKSWNPERSIASELSSPESRHKRRPAFTESEAKKKPFIFYDKAKCKGSNERFWREDTKRVVNSLNAYNVYKNLVHIWCMLQKLAKGSFEAGIMYQNSCIEGWVTA